jgi:hypothetical protein
MATLTDKKKFISKKREQEGITGPVWVLVPLGGESI